MLLRLLKKHGSMLTIRLCQWIIQDYHQDWSLVPTVPKVCSRIKHRHVEVWRTNCTIQPSLHRYSPLNQFQPLTEHLIAFARVSGHEIQTLVIRRHKLLSTMSSSLALDWETLTWSRLRTCVDKPRATTATDSRTSVTAPLKRLYAQNGPDSLSKTSTEIWYTDR